MFDGDNRLSSTRRFFDAASKPHLGHKAIHVAGTSGKGTISYLIDSILRAAGKSTGLLISPHVYDVRERAQVNGQLVSKKDYLSAANSLVPALIDRYMAGDGQNFYKFNTCLALTIFKEKKPDYAVIETGLGGMYDSTNVVEPNDKLAVISRIGKDHTEILGNTFYKIAQQKAGIIQKSNKVVALSQNKSINRAILERTAEMAAELDFVSSNDRDLLDKFGIDRWAELNPQLVGDFQNENVSLAVNAVRAVAERDGWEITDEQIKHGIISFTIPGRFERIDVGDNYFLMDGAHNEQKARALSAALARNYPGQKWAVLVAMRKDKQSAGLLRLLRPLADSFIVTAFEGSGQDMQGASIKPLTLANRISKGFAGKVHVVPDCQEAIEEALKSTTPVLVTGSFYLLKPVKSYIDQIK